MKKRIPWIVAALVVIGAIVLYVRYRQSHAPPPVTYQTAAVEKRTIVGRVTATGTINATVTVLVGSQVSGRIQSLYADYNSTVKKGQLIAKIDPSLFQAAVEQARANYQSAKADLDKAKAQSLLADRQLARTQSLNRESLASAQDLDTAESNASVAKAQIDVAQASLAQATAQLHQAETNLSYTSIVSPIDGTVISRSVDVGQTVAASLQAPTLFTIAEDLHKMQVHTNISEGDVGRLQPGIKASFTVDAFPGQRFRGTINQVRNAAQTVQNVVTYDAVIDVDNADLKLRPGMTANVTIVYSEVQDAVAIPNAALRFHPPNATSSAPRPAGSGRGRGAGPSDTKQVWILEGGDVTPKEVHVGLSDGTFTQIVGDDLHAGDAVVVDATVNEKSTNPPVPGAPAGGGGRRPF